VTTQTLTHGRAPAVAMIVGSCATLQLGAVFAQHLFPAAGSTGTTLLRLAIAALLLAAVTRPAVRAWDRTQWRAAAVLGVTLAGMNGCFYAALSRIPLGTAVTIEFLGPLALAAVLSKRVRDTSWVLLAAGGVVVLGLTGSAGGALDPAGVAFALGAGLFWAGYILAAARLGTLVPGTGGLAVALGVAALVLLPLGAAGAAPVLLRPELLPLAVATAVLASVLPYSLELAALRRLPRPVFGVLLSLEPAFAALFGWLLLSQSLGPVALLAVGAVIAASIGSTLAARP
jgi:inner membrane transporter RhtA